MVKRFQFHTKYFKILWPYRYWYNMPELRKLNVTIKILKHICWGDENYTSFKKGSK